MLESPQAEALRVHGKSFHWARHLLGPVHAERATRLYAFCREVDDLADNASSKERAVESLSEVMACLDQGLVKAPWLLDAMLLFRSTQIASWVPKALVQGVLWDLESGIIEDERALLRYCFQVAGTVGIMMSGVLDVSDPRALPHAVDLGIGMQMTNIARDVMKDAHLGRRYLPGNWVGDLDPLVIKDDSGEHVEILKAAVVRLLSLAEDYYQSGIQGLSYLPGSARLSILVAARVYREIGLEILSRDGDSLSESVYVPNLRKTQLTAMALLNPLGDIHFWRPSKGHDRRLHEEGLGDFPLGQGLLL